jgi:L-lactate utilization protein LutC
LKTPLPPILTTVEEEFEPAKYTEKDYEEAVKRLKENYPKIGKRVYKTEKKNWKQVYEEMLNIIEKEKWAPQPKTKTNQ